MTNSLIPMSHTTDSIWDLSEITPKMYFEMNTIEQLQLHLFIANYEFKNPTFNALDFLRRVGNDRINYKYRVKVNGCTKYFENAKELTDYFMCSSVRKLNVLVAKGVIVATIEKVTGFVTVDRDGNVLGDSRN